jgi:hypothetical protein|tara:strand:+ start:25 stop:234 length:210 start_codon:yes stop_codon:yes gene_type:complete
MKKLKNVTPKKEPKQSDLFTSGSHGGIDDEYYINEIIGIDECNYDDFIEDKPQVAKPTLFFFNHVKKDE